jgi:hypothetical protein
VTFLILSLGSHGMMSGRRWLHQVLAGLLGVEDRLRHSAEAVAALESEMLRALSLIQPPATAVLPPAPVAPTPLGLAPLPSEADETAPLWSSADAKSASQTVARQLTAQFSAELSPILAVAADGNGHSVLSAQHAYSL